VQAKIMAGEPNQSELDGWVIDKRRSHYSIDYWILFVVGMLLDTVPPAPDITYALRNSASGDTRKITLSGDHTRSDLIEAIARPKSGAPAVSS
jgi:hypothetical protein